MKIAPPTRILATRSEAPFPAIRAVGYRWLLAATALFFPPAMAAHADATRFAVPRHAEELRRLTADWEDALYRGHSSQNGPARLTIDGIQQSLAQPFPNPRAVGRWLADLQRVVVRGEVPRVAEVKYRVRVWLEDAGLGRPVTLTDVAALSSPRGLVTPEQAAAAFERLRRNIETLDQILEPAGSHGEGWRLFLGWDEIRRQLDAAAEVDPQAFESFARRFRDAQPYWDLELLRTIADQLQDCARAAPIAHDAEQQYSIHLRTLEKELAAYRKAPSAERRTAIAAAIGWFEEHRCSPTLVTAVRREFSRPNLHVRVASPVIYDRFRLQFDESFGIDDVLVGSRVRGQGNIEGNVTARLAPSATRGILDLMMEATTRSTTTSVQRNVQVDARDTITIRGSKRLLLDERGLSLRPARVEAQSRIEFTGISTNLRRRNLEARNRVYANRRAAELESAGRARDGAVQRLNAEVNLLAEQFNQWYFEQFRQPLLQRNAEPPAMQCRSAPDALHIQMLLAGKGQLGAPSAAPATPAADVVIEVHESFLSNLAAALLQGEQLSAEEVGERIGVFFGASPRTDAAETTESGVTDEPEVEMPGGMQMAIRFAASDPVVITLAGNQVTIRLRGEQFFTAGRAYPAMDIAVQYRIDSTSQGIVLVRKGGLQIYPPDFQPGGKARLSGPQQAQRRMLERSFAPVFADELAIANLDLGGLLGRPAPMEVAFGESRDGWLCAGWVLPPSATTEVVSHP